MEGDKEKERRAKENEEIIQRMRNGETHSLIPPAATWFPPRPLIQKDKESIKKLYGVTDDE